MFSLRPAALVVSNISSVTKNGNTINITNKTAIKDLTIDTGTTLGNVHLSVQKTTSFTYSSSGNAITLEKFKGFSITKAGVPLVHAVRVVPNGVEAKVGVGPFGKFVPIGP